MKHNELSKRIIARSLSGLMAAMLLCTVGCSSQKADTFVEITADGGAVPVEGDTFISIEGFATPDPIVTPAPTPEATPEPTKRPQSSLTDKPKESSEKAPEKKNETTPAPSTPEPEKKTDGKTPYADSYSKVGVAYEGGSSGISFDTKTLSGDSVSERLFSKADVTMINIWTRT